MDIFVTADGGEKSKIGRLEEIELFSSILRINRELEFPELSNDGEYLKVFDIQESKAQIGSPADDNENWFTVRMLLLLESRHLINPAAYTRHTKEILSVYFRDAEDHKPFKPLFLLNDILRFWRTLCLNYEQARHTPSRAWKKKNFNLRFSRMLTVFGTVLPLILDRGTMNSDEFVALTGSSPLERFASGLDQLQNASALIERSRNSLIATKSSFLPKRIAILSNCSKKKRPISTPDPQSSHDLSSTH